MRPAHPPLSRMDLCRMRCRSVLATAVVLRLPSAALPPATPARGAGIAPPTRRRLPPPVDHRSPPRTACSSRSPIIPATRAAGRAGGHAARFQRNAGGVSSRWPRCCTTRRRSWPTCCRRVRPRPLAGRGDRRPPRPRREQDGVRRRRRRGASSTPTVSARRFSGHGAVRHGSGAQLSGRAERRRAVQSQQAVRRRLRHGRQRGRAVAAHDWATPPLAVRKQGQDVKALVLLSPRWKFNGLSSTSR